MTGFMATYTMSGSLLRFT